jgi:hypothetical protein
MDVYSRRVCLSSLFVSQVSFRAEAPFLDTNGGDNRKGRFPLEEVVKVHFPMPGFRVKPHVLVDSVVARPCVVTLLGALLWSSGALGYGLTWSGIPEHMLVFVVVLFFRLLVFSVAYVYSFILGFSL